METPSVYEALASVRQIQQTLIAGQCFRGYSGRARMVSGLFGLFNIASRYAVSDSMIAVGVFYILAGAFVLIWPGISFLNPWPMGIVFCIGECVGGIITHLDQTRHLHQVSLERSSCDE